MSKMKKVAIIYGGAQNRGGIYTYLLEMFRGIPKNEIELTLISIKDWPLTEELLSEGYNVQIVPLQFSALKKDLSEYDLLVSMGMVSNFFGRIWAIGSKKPLLTIVHSDWRFDYLGKTRKKILFLITDRLFRFATTKYLTVSNYLKEQLVKEGIKDDRIVVLYNGVFDGKAVKRTVRAKHDEFVIGSIGRLHKTKNFENLIKAVAEIKNVRLEIAGEGAERPALEALTGKLGGENKIKLLGQVDPKKYLPNWDLYVQSSYSEGFGIATVEAMLAGLPVAVTPRGALTEFVKNGKTGLVAEGTRAADLRSVIEKAISDQQKLSTLSKNGQLAAMKKFDKKTWLTGLEKIFLNLS